ncbi:hypothetical protein EVAR_71496_1 [Eumeta japonica]|uniref:Uncharacterized protein n=1 Tax=Eumeta variegata TaxID=151549 RepID=A0A4C2AH89_EUMVA|nr:hypothetical protein EVAR_71496_1 [Eumeta japonica]
MDNKSNDVCMQNAVFIEDIEDDFSDDELYSPKTPKNFTETDNITDLFKIEEIKTLTAAENNHNQEAKIINSRFSESKDNNTSASLDNKTEIDFKSFSSSSFIQNQFDIPPPLSDDFNSIDNEVDDDFGDYADFQESHFISNAVPVENVYINQCKSGLEINDVSSFKSEDHTNFNNSQFDNNKPEDFGNLHSNNPSLADNFGIKSEEIVNKMLAYELQRQEFKITLYTSNEICNDYKIKIKE